MNYNWHYELTPTHTQTQCHGFLNIFWWGVLPVPVCLCVRAETGQVFKACQTDRNSGLTSCVALGCWTKVFTWAVACEMSWKTETRRFPTQSGAGHSERVCGRVWRCLRSHALEMRDLTSPPGSDLGGHVVPHIVYAGKTSDLFMYSCTDLLRLWEMHKR